MQSKAKTFLSTLPQPIVVFASAAFTALSYNQSAISPTLVVTFFILAPIPIIWLIERLLPANKQWWLSGRELLTDVFWILTSYFIWYPLFAQYYDAPISQLFHYLGQAVNLPIKLQSDSVLIVMTMALVAIAAIEFIGYWIHRLQHRFMLFWRMHATHHHVTKMSVARATRTHPLEIIGLNLGAVVVLAFFQASANLIATVLVFRVVTAYINHANLPLSPGVFGWVFNTPRWHQYHHSIKLEQSNANYGCTLIIWDRLFGTFKSGEDIPAIGNGTGKPLSIWTQLALPFYSNKAIRKL